MNELTLDRLWEMWRRITYQRITGHLPGETRSMNELMQLQAVVHAARRIGADPEGNESCGMMAPCAAEDELCRCTRLAKLALGCTLNITAAYDALPEGVQF